jgi:Methyltransferase domain
MTITNKTSFLKLVAKNLIKPALKTFSDTVLFYYLGHLAVTDSSGEISEIGVGGSTYVLTELAESHNKKFFVIDHGKIRLDQYSNTEYWPKATLEKLLLDSNELHDYHDMPQFSYCHIDGDKNFTTTRSDIEFYLNHLSVNGLICQDDYGNSKWPTVTDAVKDLEFCGKLKIIFVGDSSVWFTKSEYYEYWMNLLQLDYEFSLLSAVCNIASSEELGKNPEYFFMQSAFNFYSTEEYSQSELDYFNLLIKLETESSEYLKMPYDNQSKFGIFLKLNRKGAYRLTDIYDSLKGPAWPEKSPKTRQEIEQLPNCIKSELKNVHNINIYKRVQKI